MAADKFPDMSSFKVQKIKFTPLSVEGGEPIGEPMYTWTAEEATVTPKTSKPAGLTKLILPSSASWADAVPNGWLLRRAQYVAKGYGILPERRQSFAAALVFYSVYMNEDSVYAHFAAAVLNTGTLVKVDEKWSALPNEADEPFGSCTCSLEHLPPSSMEVKGTFIAHQCGSHSHISNVSIAVRNVARRALQRGWSTASFNLTSVNALAKGNGSYEDFIDAWDIWLPAHGFLYDPHPVSKALTFVPAMDLPDWFKPGYGLPTDSATIAYGQAQDRLHALSKIMAAKVTPEAVLASTSLGQFANLTKEGQSWYLKVKAKKKPKLAAGGYIPGPAIISADMINTVSLTSASFDYDNTITFAPGSVHTYAVTGTPLTPKKADELSLDIGAGRTLRFFKTADGRLDVELVGGKDEDLTTQAHLLLARVAELIEAKAPKDVPLHGQCLYDWMQDVVGIKLKTKTGYVPQPGVYYIGQAMEDALKSTFVSADSPPALPYEEKPQSKTSFADLLDAHPPYAGEEVPAAVTKSFISAMLAHTGMTVVVKPNMHPVKVEAGDEPVLYLTTTGLIHVAKAWKDGSLGAKPLSKIAQIAKDKWPVDGGKTYPWSSGAVGYVKTYNTGDPALPLSSLSKQTDDSTNVTVDEKFMDPSIHSLAHALAGEGVKVKQTSLYSTLPKVGPDDPPTLFITAGAAQDLQHAWQSGEVTLDTIIKELPLNDTLVNKGKVSQFLTYHTTKDADALSKDVLDKPELTLDMLMTAYHDLTFTVVPDGEWEVEFTGDPSAAKPKTIPVTKAGHEALIKGWETKEISSGMVATYVKHAFKAAKNTDSGKIYFPVLGEDAVAQVKSAVNSTLKSSIFNITSA